MSCANPPSKGPCSGGRLLQKKRYDPILCLSQVQPPRKPLRSFFIADILNAPRTYAVAAPATTSPVATGTRRTGAIKRPWDDCHSSRSGGYSTDVEDDEEVEEEDEEDEEEIRVDDEKGQGQGLLTTKSIVCPLDALLKMTSKTFDSQDKSTSENESGKRDSSGLGFGSKSQSTKKRRKSRTAFTNKQIYELEKRFLYQKYLTPVDRDEIAQSLGLSNAQVITWFQNRRAKLKRDMEELKADVTAAKSLGPETAVVGNFDDLVKPSRNGHSRKKDARNNAAGVEAMATTPGSVATASSPCSAEESSSRTSSAGNNQGPAEDAITTVSPGETARVDANDSTSLDKFKDVD